MTTRTKNLLIAIAMLPLVFGCASEVAPTGGPKDTTPPAIVESLPENHSTNFNSEIIKVTFDEFVQLDNYKQKLIVSPPLANDPDIYIKGKSLIIKTNNQLLPNTTYKFFFADAIKDFNEGNILQNYTYAFSSGDHIDSLSIKGCVTDAYTEEPVKDAMIFLYDDLSDSAFFNSKPYYVSKTNDKGEFVVDYLKNSTYNLFAIVESDNSLTYSLPTEKIAFSESVCIPTDSTYHKLRMFVKEDTTQLVSSHKSMLNNAMFTYKFPPTKPEIIFLDTVPQKRTIKFNNDKDTVNIFTENIDTLNIAVLDNNKIIDTLNFVLSSEKMIERFKLNVTPANNDVMYTDSLVVGFNNTIKSLNIDSLMVIMSHDTITDTVYRKVIHNFDNNTSKINLALTKDSQCKVFFTDSMFIDINENYSNKYQWNVKVTDEDDFGGIVLKLVQDSASNNLDGQYIVQLLDYKQNRTKKDKIVQFVANDTITLNYNLLRPGKYQFRVIHDEDGNGKWTSGDYGLRRQPERHALSKSIDVKAKFEIEETFVISPEQF